MGVCDWRHRKKCSKPGIAQAGKWREGRKKEPREKKKLSNLDAETGLAPVPPLGVVSDGVTGPEANPLGDRTVLLLSFGKLLLGTEGLVARHLEGLSRWRAGIQTVISFITH